MEIIKAERCVVWLSLLQCHHPQAGLGVLQRSLRGRDPYFLKSHRRYLTQVQLSVCFLCVLGNPEEGTLLPPARETAVRDQCITVDSHHSHHGHPVLYSGRELGSMSLRPPWIGSIAQWLSTRLLCEAVGFISSSTK